MSNVDGDSPPRALEHQNSHEQTKTLRGDAGDCYSTVVYIKITMYAALATTIACFVGFAVILAKGSTSGHDSRSRPFANVTWDAAQVDFKLRNPVARFIPFAASFLVTLCSDGLGYVHATSLRWALYREHRLDYNTNLRLFTSAKSSLPNRWFMNAITAASLIGCHASVSMILIGKPYGHGPGSGDLPDDFCVNAIALGFLGLGLLGQIVTSILCLRHHNNLIPSWSPNPLWNTLVAQRTDAIERRPGRSMLSVFDRNLPSQSRHPGTSKRVLWHIRSVRWIVVLVWILCLLSFLWPILIIYTHDLEDTIWEDDPFVFSWEPSYEGYDRGLVEFGIDGNTRVMSPSPTKRIPDAVQYFLCLLILCFFQGVQALGLHCVELLVNMSRDEHVWKKASFPHGSKPAAAPPFLAALSSWRTLLLTSLKSLLHWLIGQGLAPGYLPALPEGFGTDVYLTMSASRLLAFALATAVLALFATPMALWPVRGPQPAAWGHLQTLADLIDDWGKPLDTLWWGDKGVNENGTRHAGTATRKEDVGEIHADAWYN